MQLDQYRTMLSLGIAGLLLLAPAHVFVVGAGSEGRLAVARDNEKRRTRVLFIGNSYTYGSKLPQLFELLAESGKHKVKVESVIVGGASLMSHWKGNGEGRSEARAVIEEGRWDYVALQDQSQMPVVNPQVTLRYAEKFCELIKANGAKPVFFMTWAQQHDPKMIEKLSATYSKAAEDNDALLAPVGEVWAAVLKNRPGTDLYAKDGSHSTLKGG
ncbi:MAG: hypothetical protein MI741_16575, partial [Rhodospirillales bacterium]|nr:hypothetical protein [Rhodospirillales bacterium]